MTEKFIFVILNKKIAMQKFYPYSHEKSIMRYSHKRKCSICRLVKEVVEVVTVMVHYYNCINMVLQNG